EVEFAQWTHDGHLRAPVYQGLREDKAPEEVHREEPVAPSPDEIRKGRRLLKLSNLDKPFWPDEGITKGDLLEYYRRVAPVLVPHLRDRPFTMRRYPDWVLFDLAPSPDVGFAETIEVALYVKQALDALGLVSFPKTSGSDGIHVLVPIERRHTYDDTREFSEIVAGAIARAHRGLATT